MRSADFKALLDSRVLVFDGAMGTRLYEQGISFDHSFDELNISNPELVLDVHRGYVEAGADVVLTNSFGANRIRLSQWGLEGRVEEFTRASVALARAAEEESDRQVLVAGSMGPLGAPLAPIGRISPEAARAAFEETASALVAAGVDLIVIETFIDLREALLAIEVVRSVSPDLAIVALQSFTDEGKTLYGNKPEEVVRDLTAAGADLVGANCSMGPQGLGDVIDRMLQVPGVRLMMMPNAGMPQLVGGRYLYLCSPDYMASYAREFVSRGVRAVGGCCGTGCEHVAAMAEAVGGMAPVEVEPSQKIRIQESSESGEKVEKRPEVVSDSSTFREKLAAGEFVVSVEIDPPRGIDASRLVKGAAVCAANGIDAINIADSPLARARMTPLALATLIRQNVDVEIILHMSCRDRNILGLQSECMGSHALGTRNLLCVTGDPPQMGDYPDATGVFDVDAIGLVGLMKRLNEGNDLAGKKIDYATDFFLGVASNPTAVDPAIEQERFHRKVEAGAQFTMTQPLYDVADLDRWLSEVKMTIPLLVGILPLRNGRHAEFLHHEVPGMRVPQDIRDRMHAAGDEGPREGVAIAQEFLAAVKDRVQGAYLMPPFNRFEMAIEVCEVLD